MIEKKIKALKDFTLNAYYEPHCLIKDEVKIIKFRNQIRFERLLKFGNFIEADRDEEEIRNIPVIHAPIDDSVEKDEQELPFVEAIQNNNDLDEAGESMEQCTPEDLRRDEPPQAEEKIEEVVKEPVSKEILEDRSQTEPPIEAIGHIEDLSKLEETPEEQFEEIVPEVEEIPIEEQDENKSELQSDEVVDDRNEE